MKKKTVIFTFLLFHALPFFVQAQEKDVDGGWLKNRVRAAQNKLAVIRHRETLFEESFQKDNAENPFTTFKRVIEFVPPDRRRIISDRTAGENRTHTEVIRIGKRIFLLADDKNWKEIFFPNFESESDVPRPVRTNDNQTIKYLSLGEEKINGRRTNLYEIRTTSKYTPSGLVLILVHSQKYRFNRKGLLVKTETVSQVNDQIRFRKVVEYEYGGAFKIEAPIK